MNNEEIFDEELDFVNRFRLLEKMIEVVLKCDNSERVRAAVLTSFMIRIVKSQEYPEGALEQVLNSLRMVYEGD